jgi:arginyl-tRNA synthetase
VNYAHARINQIEEKNKDIVKKVSNLNLLKTQAEHELMIEVLMFKDVIKDVAEKYEVHKLPNYLSGLAKAFHSYYANNKVVDVTKPEISNNRYTLCLAIKNTIANGLKVMEIEAVQKM